MFASATGGGLMSSVTKPVRIILMRDGSHELTLDINPMRRSSSHLKSGGFQVPCSPLTKDKRSQNPLYAPYILISWGCPFVFNITRSDRVTSKIVLHPTHHGIYYDERFRLPINSFQPKGERKEKKTRKINKTADAKSNVKRP